MYLKIEGHLIDVLGENARGDIRSEFGIEVTPMYQFLDGDIPVTLARIIDLVKAEKLFNDNRVTVLNTIEEVNSLIDVLSEEKYVLVDSTALSIDLLLSGKSAVDIVGYDPSKGMTDKENLRALYNAGLAGIKRVPKPPYLSQ